MTVATHSCCVGLAFGRNTHNIIILKLQNVFGFISLCTFDKEKNSIKFAEKTPNLIYLYVIDMVFK
jgi:hypothetical protein